MQHIRTTPALTPSVGARLHVQAYFILRPQLLTRPESALQGGIPLVHPRPRRLYIQLGHMGWDQGPGGRAPPQVRRDQPREPDGGRRVDDI
jgi:hypothetical protein